MKASIAILPGDGIGPEVVGQAVRVLECVADRFGHQFELNEALVGGTAMDQTGVPLPEATLETCRAADAVLLGAIGGPKWDDPTASIRPEQGLLGLRKGLGVFANIRPVSIFPQLTSASPLRPELLEGVDMVVIRELTGGIYFGEKKKGDGFAVDTCVYTTEEVERIVRVACELAMKREKRLLSVDKANVLETSRFWRTITERVVREEYPDIELSHMLVDAAAMHLIRRPADFDVVVTENMFGDILTDEASMLAGSMGLLPSASLGDGRRGLYEPIHGSAPDIAGQGIANPYATILSTALLLRYSLGLEAEAAAVERAVETAVGNGVLTPDLAAFADAEGCSTETAGTAVLEALKSAEVLATS